MAALDMRFQMKRLVRRKVAPNPWYLILRLALRPASGSHPSFSGEGKNVRSMMNRRGAGFVGGQNRCSLRRGPLAGFCDMARAFGYQGELF
jgi:hypothetical protein